MGIFIKSSYTKYSKKKRLYGKYLKPVVKSNVTSFTHIRKFKTKRIRLFYINFSMAQFLLHGMHIGASLKTSLLTSYWFIFGSRYDFTMLNLTYTLIYFRHALNVVERVIFGRRKLLFVNTQNYLHKAVESLAYVIGEPYVSSR
jgi:ribosomal protein S2